MLLGLPQCGNPSRGSCSRPALSWSLQRSVAGEPMCTDCHPVHLIPDVLPEALQLRPVPESAMQLSRCLWAVPPAARQAVLGPLTTMTRRKIKHQVSLPWELPQMAEILDIVEADMSIAAWPSFVLRLATTGQLHAAAAPHRTDPSNATSLSLNVSLSPTLMTFTDGNSTLLRAIVQLECFCQKALPQPAHHMLLAHLTASTLVDPISTSPTLTA